MSQFCIRRVSPGPEREGLRVALNHLVKKIELAHMLHDLKAWST
jgi:hypothetical protein